MEQRIKAAEKDLDEFGSSVQRETESLKASLMQSLGKKADYALLESVKESLHKKVDYDYFQSVVSKVKGECQAAVEKQEHEAA